MFSMHLYLQSPSFVFEHLVALLLIKKTFCSYNLHVPVLGRECLWFLFVFFMSRVPGSGSGLKPPNNGVGAQPKVLSDRLVKPGIELGTPGYKAGDISTTPRGQ